MGPAVVVEERRARHAGERGAWVRGRRGGVGRCDPAGHHASKGQHRGGAHHQGSRRPQALPAVGLRAPRRAPGQQDGDPQLRARWVRRHPVVGHGEHGRQARAGHVPSCGGGARLRRHRSDNRAAASGPRFSGDDLRGVASPRHDFKRGGRSVRRHQHRRHGPAERPVPSTAPGGRPLRPSLSSRS